MRALSDVVVEDQHAFGSTVTVRRGRFRAAAKLSQDEEVRNERRSFTSESEKSSRKALHMSCVRQSVHEEMESGGAHSGSASSFR
mmetsp:Transcript_26291/g.102735  ORF Transcript_26291/g.102735 Transcript_26291/m.102735 type:complete len:85 (-) Transcript_26291:459-713(-)